MPAIYAHDKFGTDVISHLPPSLQEILQAYPSALHLGFQGPDVLFYHKPLKKNPPRQRGVDLHHRPADEFFIQQAKNLLAEKKLVPSPYLSYVGGFLCHFLLDVHLHPYIYQIEDTGISHGKIESELDKYLLVKENKPFRGVNTADIYTPDKGTAAACAKALSVTEQEATKAIKTMKTINRLFTCKCEAVHAVCHGALKIVGLDNKFGDMFRKKKWDEGCRLPNEKLTSLLTQTISFASEKVEEYFSNLEEIAKKEEMDKIFHINYTGGIH